MNSHAIAPIDSAHHADGSRTRLAAHLWAALALLLTAVTLWHFHDRFWHSRDTGYYAHIAERLLDGAVLHRDIQGLHTGLVYFIHAGAMELFGRDLASLRYPALVAGLVQSFLVFRLILPLGGPAAFSMALATTFVSFPQFPDPTVHWLCLAVAIAGLFILARATPKSPRKWLAMGILVGLMLTLRQLTGVLFAMGALAALLFELHDPKRTERGLLAPLLFLAIAAGTALYLGMQGQITAFLLYGLMPLLVSLRLMLHVRIENAACLRLSFRLAIGALLPFVPLFAYHIWTGSLDAWFHDAVVRALYLRGLDYVTAKSHLSYLLMPAWLAFSAPTPQALLNSVFWPALTLLPSVSGAILLLRLRADACSPAVAGPAILALFVAIVSAHHAAAAYIFYGTAPVMVALLLLATPRARSWSAAGLLAISLVALHFHAAQPFSRSGAGELRGDRRELDTFFDHPRAGLWLEREDAAAFTRMLQRIETYSSADESILAIPGDAELFFLSGRRNPLPFAFPAYGIRDEHTLADAIARLRDDPPALVFHLPELPYNTVWTDAVLDAFGCRYREIDQVAGFRILARIERSSRNMDACQQRPE
ncbi:MAG: glycosyltransferase family 39 protein [Geminicoccaceae bacterium]